MKPILVILLTVVVGFVVGSLSVNEEIRIGVTVMGDGLAFGAEQDDVGFDAALSGPDFPEVVTTLEKEVEGELCSGFTFKGDGGSICLVSRYVEEEGEFHLFIESTIDFTLILHTETRPEPAIRKIQAGEQEIVFER